MIESSLIILLICIIILCNTKIYNIDKKFTKDQNYPWRGIAIIMVVISHNIIHVGNFGAMAVGLFFLFSGYGLQIKYNKNVEWDKNYFRHKLNTIILPFFIFNVLYSIFHIAYMGENIENIYEFFKYFFCLKFMSFGWFIYILFILYIVFYIIYKMKINDKIKFFLNIIMVFILTVSLYLLKFGSWWYISLIGYIIGTILAYNEKLFKKNFSNKIVNIILLVNIIIFIISFIIINKYNLIEGNLPGVLKLIQIILFCITYIIFSLKYTIKNRFLDYVGKNTLLIYLIHPIFILLLKNVNNNYITCAIVLFISIVCTYCYNYIKSKMENKLIRKR